MQTRLADFVRDTPEGREAAAILGRCVHCGFCTATCPTYQLLGDELDGPRGRAYLIKQVLEGAEPTAKTQLHLDRCLSCRACETTCPSGVRYGRLLDIGRKLVHDKVPRSAGARLVRAAVKRGVTGPLFPVALALGRSLRPLLPGRLREQLPPRQRPGAWPRRRHARKVLMLAGCVQPVLTPNTNRLAINLLDRCGIEVIESRDGLCCGAAAMHTSNPELALEQARRLIDAWWPHIEAGAEAIVVSATGCGVNVADFGRLLAADSEYAGKAARVSELFRDLVDIVEAEIDSLEPGAGAGRRVAVHTPCTMQHGLGLGGRVERLLEQRGYQICTVAEGHLCCGSAGTYSMLQPALAKRLRRNKLAALTGDSPEIIATANIGCQVHLTDPSEPPVVHWIELV